MPKNISTNFDEFVNENSNPKSKKVDKSKIKNDIFEYLSNSNTKLSILDISKSTGYKTDHVYVAVVGIKEVKSKKVGDSICWYINENQIDPPIKIVNKVVPKSTDPVFLKIYEDDKKNSPNNRRIFLSSEEHQEYNQSRSGLKQVENKRPARRKK